MDVLRSCYSTDAVFWPGGPPITITWYRAPIGAQTFTEPSVFRSLNYGLALGTIGEVEGAPRPWRNGSNPIDSLGINVCGPTTLFSTGQSGPGVAQFKPSGARSCCFSPVAGIVGSGGAKADGSATFPNFRSCAIFNHAGTAEFDFPDQTLYGLWNPGNAGFETPDAGLHPSDLFYIFKCNDTGPGAIQLLLLAGNGGVIPPCAAPDYTAFHFPFDIAHTPGYPSGAHVLVKFFGTNRFITGSGGTLGDGTAALSYVLHFSIQGAGGARGDGNASLSFTPGAHLFFITGAGGARGDGSASSGVSFEHFITGAGGARGDGAAGLVDRPSLQDTITGSGGGKGDGAAATTSLLEYLITGSGGAKGDGHATTSQLRSTIIRYAGTVVDDSTVGTVAWSNPSNAQGAPGSPFGSWQATTNFAGAVKHGHYLHASNFGFTTADIPSGATIHGVKNYLTLEQTSGSDSAANYESWFFAKGAVLGSTNLAPAGATPSVFTQVIVGGSNNVGGLLLLDSDCRATNFGFVLALKTGSSSLAVYGSDGKGAGVQVFFSIP
jgi:hypothetical protein